MQGSSLISRLHNPLGIICGLMLLFSMLFPWWTFTMESKGVTRYANAYPYVVSHNLKLLAPFVIETPLAAEIGLLLFLTACVVSCFIASLVPPSSIHQLLRHPKRWLKEEKGKFLLSAIGVFILLYTASFFGGIYYALRIHEHTPVPLQGTISPWYGAVMSTSFHPAYYLAIASGILCLISPYIHKRLRRNSTAAA